MLVGDRRQLQPIGAGGALSIVARATAFARVDQVVRQREEWARQATMALAAGKTAEALSAYAERDHVHLHAGQKDAVQAMVETWERSTLDGRANPSLLLARTNGQVRDINAAVRARLREAGTLRGPEVTIDAVTSSGQAYRLDLAVGDEIRFLARHDGLGVINGTAAMITALRQEAGGNVRIGARIGNRDVSFTSSDVADDTGKARLAHAYASTIYGAQGLTADRAFVLLDPACDRHDAYVGLSRARENTEIFADRKLIDAGIRAEQPLSQPAGMAEPDTTERLAWLGGRLSRAGVKGTALDLLHPHPEEARRRSARRQRETDRSYEIDPA